MLRITRQTDYGVVLLAHLATPGADLQRAGSGGGRGGHPLPMAGEVPEGWPGRSPALAARRRPAATSWPGRRRPSPWPRS